MCSDPIFPAPDPNFLGFGHTLTANGGNYRFRTIRLHPYPGRTPHIHAKILSPDGAHLLTTQFYIAGDPGNDRDRLYRSLDVAEQARVTMNVSKDASGEFSAAIDVVV